MTKSKYTPSDKLRKHIALWEAADFAEQNERFGGDAIGAKHSEFMNMLGDTASKLTSNELDGLLSTYYNLSPKTFKEKLLPSVQAYANDPSAVNRQVLKDTLLNRYTLSAKKYQRGIKRRAAADVALMGFPEDEISISDLPDGGRVMRIRPLHAQKPQMDTTSIQKPLVLQPVLRVAPVREVPIQEEPHTITKVLPLTDVVGSAPEPSFGLPSLDLMLDLGSPEKLMLNHVALILGIPDIHPKLPTFRKGRVGEDEPIDGGTPFSITVTGKDRRPAWKRMYLNPNLGDTSLYYNGDAIRSITEWMPGIGDVLQGFDAYNAAKNGNYTEAAMLGGLLLLPNVIEDPLRLVNNGLFDAFKYKYSSDYRKFVQDFINETSTKGIKLNPELFAHTSQSKAPYVVIGPRKKNHTASYSAADNRLSIDFDQLNDVEKKNVPYHEGLHWLRVGETNSHLELLYNEAIHARDMGVITDNEYDAIFSNWYNNPIYKQGRDYENILRDKVSKIIYPNADDYFLKKPYEAIIHGLEAGRAIGVLPFLKYPGLREEYDAFNKAREYNSFLYDIKNQLGVWSLLNGTFAP